MWNRIARLQESRCGVEAPTQCGAGRAAGDRLKKTSKNALTCSGPNRINLRTEKMFAP